MKSYIYISIFLLFSILPASKIEAQMTIGSAGEPAKGILLQLATDNTAAALESNSDKGLGMPRVKLVTTESLSPCIDEPSLTATELRQEKLKHTGLIVYNTKAVEMLCAGLNVWEGERWVSLDDCWKDCIPARIMSISPSDDYIYFYEWSSMELSIVAKGTLPLSYQWKKDGVNLVEGPSGGWGSFLGTQTAILTKNQVEWSDGGMYTCEVKGCAGLGATAVFPRVEIQGGGWIDDQNPSFGNWSSRCYDVAQTFENESCGTASSRLSNKENFKLEKQFTFDIGQNYQNSYTNLRLVILEDPHGLVESTSNNAPTDPTEVLWNQYTLGIKIKESTVAAATGKTGADALTIKVAVKYTIVDWSGTVISEEEMPLGTDGGTTWNPGTPADGIIRIQDCQCR